MQPGCTQGDIRGRITGTIRCEARVSDDIRNNSGKSKPIFSITEAYAEQDGPQKKLEHEAVAANAGGLI
jgi:hypothetical protein